MLTWSVYHYFANNINEVNHKKSQADRILYEERLADKILAVKELLARRPKKRGP